MLKSHLQQSTKSLIPWRTKPFIFSREILVFFPINILSNKNPRKNQKKNNLIVHYNAANSTKAVLSSTKKSMSVKVVVKVQKSVGGTNFGLSRGLDDLLGKSLLLWIVAAELDPKTGIETPSIKIFANRGRDVDGETHYEANFVFPEDFGDVGAILVENEHKEMYMKNIVIDGSPHGKINITCNSWVHTKFEKRIFFTNKSYIPSQTPSGVKRLRERELVTLRGDGFGERKKYERIYDYDVYNDIGDPDSNDNGKRPVLGGKQLPYPRRCRTGRSRSKTDPLSELKSDFVYVPRDEEFSEVKSSTFSGNPIYSVLQAVVPALETIVSNPDLNFPQFPSIDSLFNVGIDVSRQGNKKNGMFNVVPRLIKAISDTETPQSLQRDKFSWLGDVEFARQTLSGFNPYSIRLVTEWPPKSKLSPEVYGPPESAMTKELIELEIGGSMTVEERGLAVEDPNEPYGLKLTIQDYPFANDGLVLWDTLKQWVTNYVNHYYPQTNLIESDKEIQAWWSEIKNVGHGDKKNEPWWPELKTPNDLIGIITTMIWVTSGHHAAVNFGQYIYAGYFPNRPTIARTKMPTEDPTNEEWESFLNKPEEALLKCLPSQLQATKLIAIMDVLSNHPPDEEYIGEIIEPYWAEDPVINASFEVFSGKLKEFEGIIDARNVDSKLMNRNGAGVTPYELLKPFSEPGVTGKGVPYSISI